MKKFLNVKNGDTFDIYIVGDIVDDSWKGWSWGEDEDTYPSDIRNLLDEAEDKDVNVYINSGGGDVFAGVAISNMLKRHKGKTRAVIDGLAGSIASVIAFGCDEIEIPANAYLMIHKPWSYGGGDANDFRKLADTLDTIQKGIETTYMNHAKVGEEEIHDMVNKETWLTGQEAQEFFNLLVTEELKAVACTSKYIKNAPHGIVLNEKVREAVENKDDLTEELLEMNKELYGI